MNIFGTKNKNVAESDVDDEFVICN